MDLKIGRKMYNEVSSKLKTPLAKGIAVDMKASGYTNIEAIKDLTTKKLGFIKLNISDITL